MTIYIVAAIAVAAAIAAFGSRLTVGARNTRGAFVVLPAGALLAAGVLIGLGLTKLDPMLVWIGIPLGAGALGAFAGLVLAARPAPTPQPGQPAQPATATNWKVAGPLLGAMAGAVAALLLLHFGVLQQINFGDGEAASAQDDGFVPQAIGEVLLDGVLVLQEDQSHKLNPGQFRGQVRNFALKPGSFDLWLLFTGPDGERARDLKVTIDPDGKTGPVTVQTNDGGLAVINGLTLSLKNGEYWRANAFELKADGVSRKFTLLVEKPNPNGLTSGNMVNTPTELGVQPQPGQPRTISGLLVHPMFEDAFKQFCGFGPEEAIATLVPNDRPRRQVGWNSTGFIQSGHTIPVGQPIWVLVSKKDGSTCRINPPCGNPEIPLGQLPQGKSQPPPVFKPTPPAGKTPPATPPGKKTPTPPPGSTPTNTPKSPPTATPRNTPTPTKTPTPVQPRCQVTIIGPHRVDNTQTQARMQASVQWDQHPNFNPTIRWFLDGTFVGGGEQIQVSASLNVNHTLSVRVFNGQTQICSDSASFAEGSIPPGSNQPGSPPISNETPIPAQPPGQPTPTPNDDGYLGP